MLCLDCGAEMRLVQVTEDTTMLVSGYEHHTWQCTGCSTTERRMIFTREKTPTPSVTIEQTHVMRAKPVQTVPIEPTSVQSAQTAPVETTVQVKASQTKAVEKTQMPVQPAIQTLPLRTNAWVKAVEKVHERQKAADAAKRSAEFKAFWDNLLSVPSPSTSSERLSHQKADDLVRSPAEPIASPAPTAPEACRPEQRLHAKELLVKRDDQIKRGQVIAQSGQTGKVNAPQLHFEVRRGATPLDPVLFLKG